MELRIGSGSTPPPSSDRLVGTVASVQLAHGTFHVSDARATWPGLDARGTATVALPDLRATGGPARSAIDLAGVVNLDARQLWHASTTGFVRVSASARGTLERIRLAMRVRPRVVPTWGQRYRLPTAMRAEWAPDRGLVLAPLSLSREGGGRLALAGRINPEGELAATLVLRALPVHALPGAASLPALAVLGGDVDADLKLGGPVAHPTLAGTLAVRASTEPRPRW
jgi:hypothetical protein